MNMHHIDLSNEECQRLAAIENRYIYDRSIRPEDFEFLLCLISPEFAERLKSL